jgi:hypothetical protein
LDSPRSKIRHSKFAKERRQVVGDIVASAILSKPRMSLQESGRNTRIPISARERRQITSLLRKANSLLVITHPSLVTQVVEARGLVKTAIRMLEGSAK